MHEKSFCVVSSRRNVGGLRSKSGPGRYELRLQQFERLDAARFQHQYAQQQSNESNEFGDSAAAGPARFARQHGFAIGFRERDQLQLAAATKADPGAISLWQN